MTAPHPLLGKVLDAVVHLPVGLATRVAEEAPQWAARGRAELSNRVTVARWVGEMSVRYARRDVRRRLEGWAREPSAGVGAVAQTAEVGTLQPPFDGYDHLAAAQVVQLLGRLPAAELRMVAEYEDANRRRRTVLSKVQQLLGER